MGLCVGGTKNYQKSGTFCPFLWGCRASGLAWVPGSGAKDIVISEGDVCVGCLAGCSCGLGVLVVVSLVLCLSLVLSGSLRYLVQCHQPVSFPCLPGDQKQASRQHCIQDLNLQAVEASTFSTRGHGKNTFLYQGQDPRPSTAPTPSPFCSAVGYSSTEACRAPFTGYKTTCTIWRPVRHSFTILFVIQIIASPVQFGANLQASSMEETYMCSGVDGVAGVLLLVCLSPGVAGWMLSHPLSFVAIHMATFMIMAQQPLLPGWLGARAALCLGWMMLDISFTILASMWPPGLTCKIRFFH